jgi:hypothetical protein
VIGNKIFIIPLHPARFRMTNLMVWKGIDNDQNIYYTQRFGGHWDPQQSGPIPGIATSSRPAL